MFGLDKYLSVLQNMAIYWKAERERYGESWMFVNSRT